MSRNAYVWGMGGFALGMTAVLVGTFYCLRFFPPTLVNLPNREYWLAPERRQETFDSIFRAGVWLATLQALLFLGVNLLVVDANTSQPVVLSSNMWLLIVAFMVATLVWICFLIQRFWRAA
jgi:serine/threonine-protein kinase